MDIIQQQVQEVLDVFPELRLNKSKNEILISGKIDINSVFNDEHIIDQYKVTIVIKDNYPDELPVIRECDKRIPLSYEHIYSDGQLCLATDEEVRLTMGTNFNLKRWIDLFVIPYLFGYSYFEKYGVMPFGERSHGNKGIKEFYKDFFKVESEKKAIDFLKFICSFKNYTYKGHHICPCGSGKKVRDCHKEILLECQGEQVRKVFNNSLRNFGVI